MNGERKRYLSDDEIGRRYHLRRNDVFQQFEAEFRKMFLDYDGVAQDELQAEWYVGIRWDSRENSLTSEEEAEKDLLKFLKDDNLGSRRSLRLLFGAAGAGKTTFLNHFFRKYLPEAHPELGEKLQPIIIDCAKTCVNVSTLERDIDMRTDRELKEKVPWLEEDPHYMDMWTEECDFDKAFYIELLSDPSPAGERKEKLKKIQPLREDPHTFNRVRINYLIKKGYNVVIVWDNLDHASQEVQQKAIVVAAHKHAWYPGIKVIISVRETTLPLTMVATAPSAYRLSYQELFPPDVHTLLERRAEAAFEALNATTARLEVAPNATADIVNIGDFIKRVLNSVKKSREIEWALCSLSVNNVRTQLKMMEHVLRSPHIPTSLIAEMVRKHYNNMNDEVRLSWRTFMETLICGEYQYRRTYGNAGSMVPNLFESGYPLPEFCNSLCMHRLLSMVNTRETNVRDVMKMLNKVGYPEMPVRQCISELMSTLLFESQHGVLPEDFKSGGEIPDYYCITCTSAGMHYLNSLIKELTYVEHMSIVTSLEEEYLMQIKPWMEISAQAGLHAGLQAGVQSAAALIAQIHKDEQRERLAAKASPEGRTIYETFGFGQLAFGMAKGCRRSLDTVRKTMLSHQRPDTVNWDLLYHLIDNSVR